MAAVLALATSGPESEAGLWLDGEPFLTAPLGTGAARGRGIVAVVASLLGRRSLEPGDLTGIAVDVGPGSFTGTRVGVTTAKALAWALGIPAVGVQSLAAIARAAPPDRAVLAIRDAGRGTLYFAAYGAEVEGRRPLEIAPTRGPAAAALSHLKGRLAVGEEAPALVTSLVAASAPAAPPEPEASVEAEAVRAGAEAVLAEAEETLRRASPRDVHTLAPFYLQASAPERLRAGEASAGGRGIDRPKG
jgi:tRNA threonylcarbamoyladenosine biosynthesis protein TsaB